MSERAGATRALDGDRRWVVEACTWRHAARGGERTQSRVGVRLDDLRRCVLVDVPDRDDTVDFDVGISLSLCASSGAPSGGWVGGERTRDVMERDGAENR